ncbi:MAG: Asp-tRNA(Asn)/Glu-tRNA(Gln) amidotransferase subunit GatC [Candidatus Curtissbacteria bacterium]|nr:Asp-tRNA(Asn)/Glu-tRNA(Gln) amidotransferase subunit GatC [Candidatus Curtissbacteria bacterium]
MKSAKSPAINIEYLAKLANLPLTEQEKQKFEKQLQEILSYISKLNEVDTKKVEPIGHITGLANVTRPDEAKSSLNPDESLKNAPKIHNGFFEVDAIFEE